MSLLRRKLIPVFTAVAFAQPAAAIELQADVDHSSVSFDIKHLMISTMRGSFTEFDGTIEADEKDGVPTRAAFVVKTSSINTAHKKRDEHLRSADFFDAEKHPEARFVSTGIRKAGKEKYVVDGDLTIRGVTKRVTLDLVASGRRKDPWGNQKYGYQATAQINRKDFGILWNQKLDSGGLLVGEDVKLILNIEAAPKKAAQSS